jgi:hypothetical protein
MTAFLDKIERLAKEADDEEWFDIAAICSYSQGWMSDDAEFIAACSPAAVLAMVAVCREALEHIESMDAYEGGDLVPMNRTRGTTARLRSAIEALDSMQKEGAKG